MLCCWVNNNDVKGITYKMKLEITESSENYALGTYGDFNFAAERDTRDSNWVVAITNPKNGIMKVNTLSNSKDLTINDVCNYAASMMFIHSQGHSVDALYNALYQLSAQIQPSENLPAVNLLLESAERMKTLMELVDGCYSIVEIWNAPSDAQKSWKTNWLAKARHCGANPE